MEDNLEQNKMNWLRLRSDNELFGCIKFSQLKCKEKLLSLRWIALTKILSLSTYIDLNVKYLMRFGIS